MLLLHLIFLQNVLLFISSISVGRGKLHYNVMVVSHKDHPCNIMVVTQNSFACAVFIISFNVAGLP